MPTNLRYSKARRDLAKALYVIGNSELEIDNLFDVSPGTTKVNLGRYNSYTRDSISSNFEIQARNNHITLAELLDRIAVENGERSFGTLCSQLGIEYSEKKVTPSFSIGKQQYEIELMKALRVEGFSLKQIGNSFGISESNTGPYINQEIKPQRNIQRNIELIRAQETTDAINEKVSISERRDKAAKHLKYGSFEELKADVLSGKLVTREQKLTRKRVGNKTLFKFVKKILDQQNK